MPPEEQGLALAPSGAIVIGNVVAPDSVSVGSGPYVSVNGTDWRSIGLDSLGIETFMYEGIYMTPTEVMLAGTPCAGCDIRTWRSTDGAIWEDAGELTSGAPYTGIRSFATTNNLTVAAVVGCGSTCDTEAGAAPFEPEAICSGAR